MLVLIFVAGIYWSPLDLNGGGLRGEGGALENAFCLDCEDTLSEHAGLGNSFHFGNRIIVFLQNTITAQGVDLHSKMLKLSAL